MLNQLLIKPSLTKIKDPDEPSPSMLSYEYEIELGREMELSFGQLGLGNVDSGTGNVMDNENIECVELAVSDIAISDNPPSEAAGSDSSYSEAAAARGWAGPRSCLRHRKQTPQRAPRPAWRGPHRQTGIRPQKVLPPACPGPCRPRTHRP